MIPFSTSKQNSSSCSRFTTDLGSFMMVDPGTGRLKISCDLSSGVNEPQFSDIYISRRAVQDSFVLGISRRVPLTECGPEEVLCPHCSVLPPFCVSGDNLTAQPSTLRSGFVLQCMESLLWDCTEKMHVICARNLPPKHFELS